MTDAPAAPPSAAVGPAELPLAEVVGSLSLATDLAAGLGPETAVRTCFLATGIGRELGLAGEELRDVYYTALLRFIGCTAFAAESARYGAGDDQAFLRAFTPVDTGKPIAVLRAIVGRVGAGAPAGQRARAVARTLLDPEGPRKLASAHCALAVELGGRLGMSAAVVAALGQIYERFDGKGAPAGLRGARLAPAARIMHVAWRAEVHRAIEGAGTVAAVIADRAGGELDPEIASAFLRRAGELLSVAGAPSAWEAFLAAEPAPRRRVASADLPALARAFAHYVDVKSPFTLGHSVGVAELCTRAAARAGLPEGERAALEIAALLHDIGRVSVPNGIWDKPGALTPLEWERVRQHSYHGERILARTPLLAPYAALAGAAHERADGSGYHRGRSGAAPSRAAAMLAAADVLHALGEPRPHRAALSPDAAGALLAAEVRAGRLERDAVAAVLGAAGQPAPPLPGARPAGLSEREVEVLCLLARGQSNKEMAARLGISPRTVQTHLEHVFEKIGVRTRAAAAVFAVEQRLTGRT